MFGLADRETFSIEHLIANIATGLLLLGNRLGYLKDSNATAHSVDTGISLTVGLKRIENDI